MNLLFLLRKIEIIVKPGNTARNLQYGDERRYKGANK